MKKLTFSIIAFVSIAIYTNKSFGQSDYYWYNNQKIFLEKIPNKKYLLLGEIADTNELKQNLNLTNAKVKKFAKTNVLTSMHSYHNKVKDEKKWAIIEKDNIINETLTSRQEIIYEASFYKTTAQKEVGLSHLFYVKLFNSSDLGKLETLALEQHVEILGSNKFMPLWFTLSCSKQSSGNALAMANTFHESGLFNAAEPDWMVNYFAQSTPCPNDPLFSLQWGLNNTGQAGPPGGIDINACDAWQITKGSNNIIVAVIDQGLEVINPHQDLTNIHPVSYDTQSGTSPSALYFSHGVSVAGIIGANHNNIGVVGIAPNCPLMSVSNPLNGNLDPYPGLVIKLADGINFAWQNGASVINNSWGSTTFLPVVALDNAITAAQTQGRNGLGCVVVCSSGNDGVSTVAYPASSLINPDILAVGMVGTNGYALSSNYGSQIDLVAAGTGASTSPGNAYVTSFVGTSAAAPAVAAVAALVLSVNHNLTQKQVVDILERTAQKNLSPLHVFATQPGNVRPNGTWNVQVGYGMVDAYAAVLMAKELCSELHTPILDLFSKDGYKDFGFEPNPAISYTLHNPSNSNVSNSPDIWVRNQPDGLTNFKSQDPEYSSTNDPTQLNYVYVRVRNRSCQSNFLPGENEVSGTLNLSWSKAATTMAWPNNWDGSTFLAPGALAGNLIGNITIPPIPPGGDVILSFPWNPPNPATYTVINGEPWHFCLLSRIIHPNDPINYAEGVYVAANVQSNNNIVWKNLKVVDNRWLKSGSGKCPKDIMEGIGAAVAVSNPDSIPFTYDIVFKVPDEELKNSIVNEGKVHVALDKHLYDLWVSGGKQGTGFTEILNAPDTNTYIVSKRKIFEITSLSASFNNITFNAGEFATTSMMILYPTTPLSTKQEFKYTILQKRTNSDASLGEQIIGALHYDIFKPNCSDKITNAGSDRTIEKGNSTTLTAKYTECGQHHWIKENGHIIGSDSNITVSPNKTTTYTLKTISAEGCFSEAKVKVTVSDSLRHIKEINPNPASDDVTIKYKIKNVETAQIRLLKIDNSIDKSFNLSVPSHEIVLNISDCTPGIYSVILICDGVIEDSKTLIIQ